MVNSMSLTRFVGFFFAGANVSHLRETASLSWFDKNFVSHDETNIYGSQSPWSEHLMIQSSTCSAQS